MSASFPEIKIEAQAREANGVTMPPFWELEILIAQGYGLEQALAVMARRRDNHLPPSCELLRKTASNTRNASALRGRRAVSA